MTPLHQVSEFHRTFLIPEPLEPTFAPDIIAHRYRLMHEEAREYHGAATRHDALDACCDFMYVLMGSVLELGLRTSYSAIYDSRYPAPSKVRESLLDLCERFRSDVHPELTLGDMQYELEALVKEEGFEDIFEEAFARVQRANMRKLWDDQEVTAHQLAGNCEGWEYLPSRQDGLWVVKFRSKIKKPTSFTPPDFSDLLDRVAAPA